MMNRQTTGGNITLYNKMPTAYLQRRQSTHTHILAYYYIRCRSTNQHPKCTVCLSVKEMQFYIILFSEAAMLSSKSFMTSVVVGKDVVPRLGLHQMETLRKHHASDPCILVELFNPSSHRSRVIQPILPS